MNRKTLVLALVLLMAGCKHVEHSGSVTVVIQPNDSCRHRMRDRDLPQSTSLKTEVRIEYRIKGQAPDEESCDESRR